MPHDHDAHRAASASSRGRAEDVDRSAQAGVGALSYRDLPGLEDVALEDSFVREVAQDGGTLTFVLSAALRKSHPFFSGARSNERHCFRSATLTFREAQVKWRSRTGVRFVDADGAVDVGNIDILVAPPEGGYHIEGDFGVLDVVRSRAPVFTVIGESSGVRAHRRNILQRWVRTGDAISPEPHEHTHSHGPPAQDDAHAHAHAHSHDAPVSGRT